eukprot:s4656_g1.t1
MVKVDAKGFDDIEVQALFEVMVTECVESGESFDWHLIQNSTLCRARIAAKNVNCKKFKGEEALVTYAYHKSTGMITVSCGAVFMDGSEQMLSEVLKNYKNVIANGRVDPLPEGAQMWGKALNYLMENGIASQYVKYQDDQPGVGSSEDPKERQLFVPKEEEFHAAVADLCLTEQFDLTQSDEGGWDSLQETDQVMAQAKAKSIPSRVRSGYRRQESELLVDFGHDPELRGNVRQACKYSLAAIFYFYLSMEDQSPGMRTSWQIIRDKGLLTEAEIRRVSDFPGTVFMLLLHWASIAIKDNVKKLRGKQGQYTPPELAAMSSRLYVLVDRIGVSCLTVRSIQNMPVPFSYFHLLNILISLTVLATGIGSLILVEQHDSPSYCLAFFPYSVVTFVLLALRQLSGELADPFGEDDLDFPIADFMRHIYDNVIAMLAMYERFSVLDALKLSPNIEFSSDMVKRPCSGETKEHEALTGLLARSASRMPTKQSSARSSMAGWLLLNEDDEISAYGPRNWVPTALQDWKGAAKLIRWLDGDEPKANMIGILVDEEKLDEVLPAKDPEPIKAAEKAPEKTLPKVPGPNNKEALTEDSKCAASLQRIEKQMAQLITCMSDLAASIKEAPESRKGKGERSEKNDKSEVSKKSRSTKKAGEEKVEE